MRRAIASCVLALGLTVPAVAQEITVEPLTTAPGFGQCQDLNDHGQVVGDWGGHAFLWTREGGLVDLGLSYSSPRAISNGGEIIGQKIDAAGTGWEAFYRDAAGEVSVVTYPGATFTYLTDINNAGIVAGIAQVGSDYHGFFWTAAAGFADLPAGVTPTAINDVGEVVGERLVGGWVQAFIWSASYGTVDLGVLRLESRAKGVNQAGLVVGYADDEIDQRIGAFAFSASRDQALALLALAPQDTGSYAWGVDPEGYVVGLAIHPRQPPAVGEAGWPVLWTPAGTRLDLPVPANAVDWGGAALKVNARGQACGWQYVQDETQSWPRAIPLLWTFKKTPQQIVTQLQQMVQALKDAGSINGGQANALLVKLAAALAAIEGSDPAVAIARLQDFVNQVGAFMQAGILTSAEGQPMIDLAQQAIAQLQSQL